MSSNRKTRLAISSVKVIVKRLVAKVMRGSFKQLTYVRAWDVDLTTNRRRRFAGFTLLGQRIPSQQLRSTQLSFISVLSDVNKVTRVASASSSTTLAHIYPINHPKGSKSDLAVESATKKLREFLLNHSLLINLLWLNQLNKRLLEVAVRYTMFTNATVRPHPASMTWCAVLIWASQI